MNTTCFASCAAREPPVVRRMTYGRMVRDTGRILALLYAIKVRGLVDGAVTMTITQSGLQLLASADEHVETAIRQQMAGIEEQKLRATVDIMEALRTGS